MSSILFNKLKNQIKNTKSKNFEEIIENIFTTKNGKDNDEIKQINFNEGLSLLVVAYNRLIKISRSFFEKILSLFHRSKKEKEKDLKDLKDLNIENANTMKEKYGTHGESLMSCFLAYSGFLCGQQDNHKRLIKINQESIYKDLKKLGELEKIDDGSFKSLEKGGELYKLNDGITAAQGNQDHRDLPYAQMCRVMGLENSKSVNQAKYYNYLFNELLELKKQWCDAANEEECGTVKNMFIRKIKVIQFHCLNEQDENKNFLSFYQQNVQKPYNDLTAKLKLITTFQLSE